MYDEIERTAGGSQGRGLSILGWIVIGFVGLSLTGIAVTAVGYVLVRDQVREMVDRFQIDDDTRMSRDVSDAVAGTVASALASLDPALLGSDAESGRMLLRSLQSGRLDPAELQDVIEGSLRIRTGEGDVTMDLRGNEAGGELRIDSPEGPARLQLSRSNEGGVLTITADGETVRFGAGDAAAEAPSWVPPAPAMPAHPRQVMSAASGQGLFGALTWESRQAPEAVVEAYRERLEGAGFLLRGEHSMRDRGRRSASVSGHDEATSRMVFLVASRDDGVTRIVLGYGEEMER